MEALRKFKARTRWMLLPSQSIVCALASLLLWLGTSTAKAQSSSEVPCTSLHVAGLPRVHELAMMVPIHRGGAFFNRPRRKVRNLFSRSNRESNTCSTSGSNSSDNSSSTFQGNDSMDESNFTQTTCSTSGIIQEGDHGRVMVEFKQYLDDNNATINPIQMADVRHEAKHRVAEKSGLALTLKVAESVVSSTKVVALESIVQKGAQRAIHHASQRAGERTGERIMERTAERLTSSSRPRAGFFSKFSRFAKSTFNRWMGGATTATIGHVGERSLEMTGERLAERVAERSMEQVAARGSGKIAERVTERVSEMGGERFAERAGKIVAERAGDRALARVGDRTAERAAEQAAERVSERVGEIVAKRATERASERSGKRVVEHIGEQLAERAIDNFGERASEVVGERLGERFAERIGEIATELVAERASGRAMEHVGGRVGERATERAMDRITLPVANRSRERIGKQTMSNAAGVMERVLGIPAERIALRVGRGLLIALPAAGGIFALHLLRSDLRRVTQEHKLKHRGSLMVFVAAAVADLIDSFLHFWIAYAVIRDLSHHRLRVAERMSFACAIVSTSAAVLGEIISHRMEQQTRGKKSNVSLA